MGQIKVLEKVGYHYRNPFMISNGSYIFTILSRMFIFRFWVYVLKTEAIFLVEVLVCGITASAFFLVGKSQSIY